MFGHILENIEKLELNKSLVEDICNCLTANPNETPILKTQVLIFLYEYLKDTREYLKDTQDDRLQLFNNLLLDKLSTGILCDNLSKEINFNKNSIAEILIWLHLRKPKSLKFVDINLSQKRINAILTILQKDEIQEIHFESCPSFINYEIKFMIPLLEKLNHLTSLTLINLDFLHIRNIQEYQRLVSAMCKMSKLKNLELCHNFTEENKVGVNLFLSHLTELVELKFTSCINKVNQRWITLLFPALANCKKLNTIHFSFNISEMYEESKNNFKKIAQFCPKLQSLEFSGLHNYSNEDFNLIQETLINMKELNCLKLNGISFQLLNDSHLTCIENILSKCRNITTLELNGVGLRSKFSQNQWQRFCTMIKNSNITVIHTHYLRMSPEQISEINVLLETNISNYAFNQPQGSLYHLCHQFFWRQPNASLVNNTDNGLALFDCDNFNQAITEEEKQVLEAGKLYQSMGLSNQS